jgi:hypothetical protein
MRSLAMLLVAATVLTACDAILHDEPELCAPPEHPEIITETVDLVDPATLACSSFEFTCDVASCIECQPFDQVPSWSHCESACKPLDEAACGAAAGCRVTRTAEGFLGCFELTGFLDATSCEGLGAEDCSHVHACATVYDRLPDGALQFKSCTAVTPDA